MIKLFAARLLPKNDSKRCLERKISKRCPERCHIDTCPNSLRVLRFAQWTPADLKANHKLVLQKLWSHYGVDGSIVATAVSVDGAKPELEDAE
jgi:hypothetical protein